MKDLIEKIKQLEPYEMQEFIDKKFGGSCPCFWGRLKVGGHYIGLHGHCWRSEEDGGNCPYNGLHIRSKLPKKEIEPLIKAIVKKLNAQKWYSKWDIVYELSK